MIRRSILALLASLALAGCAETPHPGTASAGGPVEVGIVAINDFHGNLLPPHQSVFAPNGKGSFIQVPAGGAAWLASAIDAIRGKYPNHLTVSAGDLISAAPTLDSQFLDEPTIGVMNRIGLDFNAVGNHEFDRGAQELKRLAQGGCEQYGIGKPCQVERFAGANFPFLAANTLTADGTPLFPASALRSFGSGARKVTVGLIGVTTRNTGDLASPAARAGLHWSDEADAANAEVPKLKAAGADAIILLIHQGGRTDSDRPDPNSCDNLHGDSRDDIRPILARLDPAIDVVVSAHTHWAYVCDWPSRDPARHFLLTSAGLWGKLATDIALEIDPATHRVVAKRAHNVIVQSPGYTGAIAPIVNTDAFPQFAPRADIAAYIETYRKAGQAVLDRKVGFLPGPAEKTTGKDFNTGGALGALIADADLAATRPAGAQFALINPFAVRVSLEPAPDGSVTFGQISQVEPFRNVLITMTLTGAELKTALEEGFDAKGPEQVLTPSAGFVYHYDRSKPIGSRIVSMTLDGQPIRPEASYRVTAPDFLADGGDTFDSFTVGRDRTHGMIDVAALEAWIKPNPPRPLPSDARAVDDRPELKTYNSSAPPGQHYR
jgi:5'-nucleotidase